jgi:type IV pilus assembly protein PilW
MTTPRHTSTAGRARPATQRGVGLIEVMVSMLVGVIMVIGAVNVYSSVSKNYTTHEQSAALEEAGRYVISVLEPDVRMAGYWGLTKGAVSISGGSSQLTGTTNATGTYGTAVSMCGLNFAVDLQTAVEGSNDGYLPNAGAGCTAKTTPMPTADTLTVRHASVAATAVTGTGPLYICSTTVAAQLTNNSTGCTPQPVLTPTGATVNAGVYDLVVNTYYVNKDSNTVNGLPTLYRQTLTNTSAAPPSIVNTEILAGVEDLQVQFGIDPTGTTGVASQYVDAQTAMQLSQGLATSTAQIVAVRIWVLLRSDTPEPGFVDNRIYQYANRSFAAGVVSSLKLAGAAGKAYAPNDNYRRLLVTRTVMLRNALGT